MPARCCGTPIGYSRASAGAARAADRLKAVTNFLMVNMGRTPWFLRLAGDTRGWLEDGLNNEKLVRLGPRLGDEADLGQPGPTGGAHRFGHRFVAPGAVGLEVHLDIGVLRHSVAEFLLQTVTAHRIVADIDDDLAG